MTFIFPTKLEKNLLGLYTRFVSTSIPLCQLLEQVNVEMNKVSQTHQVNVYTNVSRMSTTRMNHASHVRIPATQVVFDQVTAETV